jgi:hypothetical protein
LLSYLCRGAETPQNGWVKWLAVVSWFLPQQVLAATWSCRREEEEDGLLTSVADEDGAIATCLDPCRPFPQG